MIYPIHFLVAAVATICFAVLFSAPAKDLLFCGFSGGLGWIVYFILTHLGVGVVASSLVATFCLTIFSRIFAIRRKKPVTLYLLTGIFPLVPGAGIYYTAYYFFTANEEMLSSKGSEALEVALAIVFGIIFGFGIPQKVFAKLFSPKQK